MSTLVRISASATKGWANVLIDSAYAESFYRKIRSLQLGTTPLQEVDFRAMKVVEGADGKKRVVTETVDRVFEVQATLQSLESPLSRWAVMLG
jgi:hypothetical protein